MVKRSLQRIAITLAVIACGAAFAGAMQGAKAAGSDTVLSYSCLLEMAPPEEVWRVIDAADYGAVPLSSPAGYYDKVDATSSDTLRASIHALIDAHIVFAYSVSGTPDDAEFEVDTWDIVALADAHPHEPGCVLDVYLNGTFERQYSRTSANPHYDREHSWPKSLGFSSESSPAYRDCHHLFAAYPSYNSSRSNNPYGECDGGTAKPTELNVGRGGEGEGNERCSDVWETWIGRRGDVARAMFYMDVRYEGDAPAEPDLQLIDDVWLIGESSASAWRTRSVAYMGVLSVLLEWHREDPVDDQERRRNSVVYLFQRNRNPFVDHPEWVEIVFGS